MIDKHMDNTRNSGVSPVIGIILMVAVVVILAAIIGVYAVALSDSTQSNVTAGVAVDETETGVTVRWTSSGNAEEVVVLVDGEQIEGTRLTGVGDSVTISAKENDTVSVVGLGSNETRTEIQSVTASSDTTSGSESPQLVSKSGGGETEISTDSDEVGGVVSLNPKIEGATVVSYDSDGNQIDTATTDANGIYVVEAVEGGQLIVNSTGETQYNGNPVYASAEKEVTDMSERVSFDFDESATTSTTAEVNGETVFVAYKTEGGSGSNQIGNIHQLQAINQNLSADYELIRDIDASGTNSWNSDSGTANGFEPVGSSTSPFKGNFDGQNHTISNLMIDQSQEKVGLFGIAENRNNPTSISNVQLENVDISANQGTVGGLAGEVSGTDVTNVSVSGNIQGSESQAGSVVGELRYAVLTQSHGSGEVSGGSYVGGLVGYGYSVDINNVYSEATVTGSGSGVGGLIGKIASSNSERVEKTYATGDVSSDGEAVGGLVGHTQNVEVYNSYATGDVSTDGNKAGGLVGHNGLTVEDSYATGDVTGASRVGALVGDNVYSYIEDSYAVGSVTGDENLGGLAGKADYGDSYSSYWDIDTTGQSTSAGDPYAGTTGLTTTQMTGSSAKDTMEGFDFDREWNIRTNNYPNLDWEN